MTDDRAGRPETGDLLRVEGLSVAFGDTRVLRDLSLSIRQGEIVGLLGESGSGKSTAAYAMLGLAKSPGRIVSGRILFNGQDLLTMRDADLRRVRGGQIGLIVQNPRSALHPMLRVGRQIGEVWKAHNKGADSAAQAQALEMLRLVGINDPERRLKAFAHELSGGMAQRVLIAMALSSKPQLLIADEPTSGLDVTIQAQFLDQMWQTVKQTGSSVLLVTQEDGIIANYCDRVLVLKDGCIVDQDDTRSFFARNRAASLAESTSQVGTPPAATASQVPPLLDVRNLKKTFPVPHSEKRVHAVTDLNLQIAPGETVGLVGESGSGKSTAGRSIIRLTDPDSGSVTFQGKDLSKLKRNELTSLRSRMQIILQDPYDSVDGRWTIERILEEPLSVHSDLSRDKRRARIRELIHLVELGEDILKMRPRDLGAGALQRVSIARSLATDPDFVILDEPTSVLAPSARARLISLLRRLQRELSLSFLFISHDLTTVSQVCDRVIVMYLSQIVEVGRTSDIFNNPQHPYTRALIASHLSPDTNNRRVDREIKDSLAGEIPSPIDLPTGCYLHSRCPYRQERCQNEPQALAPLGKDREVRCWRAHDLSNGLDAPAPSPAVRHG